MSCQASRTGVFEFCSGCSELQRPRKSLVLQVTVSHLKDFFVDFARNDSLGQIANAWVAWADQLEEVLQSRLHLAVACCSLNLTS